MKYYDVTLARFSHLRLGDGVATIEVDDNDSKGLITKECLIEFKKKMAIDIKTGEEYPFLRRDEFKRVDNYIQPGKYYTVYISPRNYSFLEEKMKNFELKNQKWLKTNPIDLASLKKDPLFHNSDLLTPNFYKNKPISSDKIENAYQYLVSYYKKHLRQADYDLLLSILLYIKKEEVVIHDLYRLSVFYGNKELIFSCMEQIINDLEIKKEQLYEQVGGIEEDLIVFKLFPNALEILCQVETDNEDILSLWNEYFGQHKGQVIEKYIK